MKKAVILIAVVVLIAAVAGVYFLRKGGQNQSRFTVPAGFAVELVAPASQTGSVVALTFDSLGRPVISKEKGGPTILIDQDGDGLYETEKEFTDKVIGAQGLWFDGRTLYAVASNQEKQAGVYKLADDNGDDQADSIETLIEFTGPMGEHGPHHIYRGADGRPLIILGNHTGIDPAQANPLSPLNKPEESQFLPRYMDARGHAVDKMAPGGTIWRLDLEGGKHTLLSGGFRNAYDFGSTLDGEVFTWDSDMEWDIGMPWYRPVRTVHAVPGGDYGWRTGSGKFPSYYIDSLPPLDEQGRGSPVGVDFYQHYAFPKEYFGAFLEGDWSRGRILITHLEKEGGAYKPAKEPENFVYGEPLNVTDVKVAPDGSVFFTMGGRDTEGGVYRVVYKGWSGGNWGEKVEGAMAAVRQPQPLSSWGHAEILKVKEQLGEQWGPELQKIATDTGADPLDRVRALLLLERTGPRPSYDLLKPLTEDGEAQVRSAAFYVVGCHGSDRAKALAASGIDDDDPMVRRRALEAVVRMGLTPEQNFVPVEKLLDLLNDENRFVRWAARLALERTPRAEWEGKVLETEDPLTAAEGLVALIRTAPSSAQLQPVLERAANWIARSGLSHENFLRLSRTVQLAVVKADGNLPINYRERVDAVLRPILPSGEEPVDREIVRMIAWADRPGAVEFILKHMPEGEDNKPLQIEYAYALRTIEDSWTPEAKKQMIGWFEKAQHWRGGASFPGFINFLFDSTVAHFSDEEKQLAYQRVPDYAPLSLEELAANTDRRGYQRAGVFAKQKGVEGVSEQEIFEFMMYDPMTLKADPAKGAAVYEKAKCVDCHRFGDRGKDFGPDLTTIASRFKRKDLVEAVLWPSKTISDLYAAEEVTMKNGASYIGNVVAEEPDAIHFQVIPNPPIKIAKNQIAKREPSKRSPMMEGLLDGLSMTEIADLFAYLGKGTEARASD